MSSQAAWYSSWYSLVLSNCKLSDSLLRFTDSIGVVGKEKHRLEVVNITHTAGYWMKNIVMTDRYALDVE